MVRSCTRARFEACYRRGLSLVRDVVRAWWELSYEREIVTMASKGVEASDVLEEERGGRETRGDAWGRETEEKEQHVTLDSEEDGGGTIEPLEGKLEGAFNSFMANMGRAVEELKGCFARNGGRDKSRRTSSPCGGMEATRDGSGEWPKRKQGCFLCGGPHWTRECPRQDALNAIIRAGEDFSNRGEVNHMGKSEPVEAEDVASISHNLRQRQGSNAAKREEFGHTGEPKLEESRDVAQDAGDSRQQHDVDATETCGNLREGSRHSMRGALMRASRALVGESVMAREFEGRTSRSASVDMRAGASTSTSTGASGSAIGSVDWACEMRVLVLRHGVAITTLTHMRVEVQSWIVQDAAGLASGGVNIGAVAGTHGQAGSRRWHAWVQYGSRHIGARARAQTRARVRHGMPKRRARHELAASMPRSWHEVTVETCWSMQERPKKF
ncbi:hypothetical protein SLEP1_g9797 [Rubroshorea leprosula]|uniref:Uncharacterized protein n=1 Tax=Rubroshorea leprosula TaxID=152421 RepID=A0AAV5I609_9ROSI|nr:hypothetical protein SLEP1_g9797 [Rubroshorea leprosula]